MINFDRETIKKKRQDRLAKAKKALEERSILRETSQTVEVVGTPRKTTEKEKFKQSPFQARNETKVGSNAEAADKHFSGLKRPLEAFKRGMQTKIKGIIAGNKQPGQPKPTSLFGQHKSVRLAHHLSTRLSR